jgi:hypothetical protein
MLVNRHRMLGSEQVPRDPLPHLARQHPLIQPTNRSDEALRLVSGQPTTHQLGSIQLKNGHDSTPRQLASSSFPYQIRARRPVIVPTSAHATRSLR